MYHDQLRGLSPQVLCNTLNSCEILSRGDCPYRQPLSSVGPHLEPCTTAQAIPYIDPSGLFELSCRTVPHGTPTNPPLAGCLMSSLSVIATASAQIVFEMIVSQWSTANCDFLIRNWCATTKTCCVHGSWGAQGLNVYHMGR